MIGAGLSACGEDGALRFPDFPNDAAQRSPADLAVPPDGAPVVADLAARPDGPPRDLASRPDGPPHRCCEACMNGRCWADGVGVVVCSWDPMHTCHDYPTDIQVDRYNCGACGVICLMGTVCVMGMCR